MQYASIERPTQYGSFGSRLVAYLIDQTIIAIIVAVAAYLFGATSNPRVSLDAPTTPESYVLPLPVLIMDTLSQSGYAQWKIQLGSNFDILPGLVVFVVSFFYFGFLWSAQGRTLGMRLMRIRAVNRNGSNMSFMSAAFRGTFGYIISGLIFYIGFLWALWDRNRQTWHDKLSGTVVLAD